MSSHTFDPNSFTVEEIFRAKQARRKLLAKLPLEEKIKIVERLQSLSAAMKNEKLTFDSFLKACPDFADEPIVEWDMVEDFYGKRDLAPPTPPFDKRPDVICITSSGKKIGVELKSWVNREQITEARKQERIQDNILKAIGEQPLNATQHIGQVWLSAKQVTFNARDASDFKKQMFELIEKVEHSWLHKPQGHQNSWHDVRDLAAFPFLEKYLDSARFHSVRRRLVNNWILFPNPYPSGHYSPKAMRETLKRALLAHKDDERYKDLKQRVGLDEVYLLVHYDFKAFVYNTPFAAPDFGFREAADLASSELGGDGGYFDRIFLFHFLWSKEEARRIL
jgi:hypothetical protein